MQEHRNKSRLADSMKILLLPKTNSASKLRRAKSRIAQQLRVSALRSPASKRPLPGAALSPLSSAQSDLTDKTTSILALPALSLLAHN